MFLRGFIESLSESDSVANARILGLVLFMYAQDHQGKYPDGKSSTEVFQKLLNDGYLRGSAEGSGLEALYWPIPGKVKANVGTKILKPENVCWDVTCCIDGSTPHELPAVFLTGYKVTYLANAKAIPFFHPPRTWSDWWHGREYPPFITVNYMTNSSLLLRASPDGTIPNFIPDGFYTPPGTTYRQLTPDGSLPP